MVEMEDCPFLWIKSDMWAGLDGMGWRYFEYLRPELLTVSCSGREIFCDLSLSPF